MPTATTHTPDASRAALAAVIRVGDTVRCIDAAHSFHRLAEGATYTVEAAYDGTPTVIVNRAYHSLERFELVERKAAD